MTANEIQAWARITNMSRDCTGREVMIRRDDGKYMSRGDGPGQWNWVDDPALAYIQDYDSNDVGGQLMTVELKFGAKWTAEIVKE